jgi:hypothetical protein
MAEPTDLSASPRKRRERRKDAPQVAEPARGEPPSGDAKPQDNAAKTGSLEKTLATWTIVLGVCVFVLSIATIISAYFLFAADQTIKQQVGVTLAQLRAYVGTQQIIYAPKVNAESGRPPDFLGSVLGVTWKNFGATPAKELEYWVSAKWYPPGSEPDFSKPSEKIPERVFMTLGAGAENSSPGLFVPAADVEKAMSGQGRVFFWGEASYRDVFPDTPRRFFRFCLVVLSMPKAASEPPAFSIYKPACNSSN